jgi:hypothetical protein
VSTTKPLTDSLIKSGSNITPRSVNYVMNQFKIYNVVKYAVYIDHTTSIDDIPHSKTHENIGYYTLDVNLIGKNMGTAIVQLLTLEHLNESSIQGWIVASTNRSAAFNLSRILKKSGHESQIIVRLYDGQVTRMDAYMDFFSGCTETVNYINHYFNRKYRVIFPIDIRYQIRDCHGLVVYSGQKIVNPGAITIIDSRDFEFDGNFKGYLYIELEVENLQVRVQPFIHFWADYHSQSGICRNHQSGWAAHSAGSVFNRGILPINNELEAVGSFYNENDVAISPEILLHYHQDGEEKKIERKLEPIASGNMSYVNYSEMFEELDFLNVNSAYILIRCDQPMHRPNHYIKMKCCDDYIDTYHQTRGAGMHWAPPSTKYTQAEIEIFSKHNMNPWVLSFPVLSERFSINSYIGQLSELVARNEAFNVAFYNSESELVFSQVKTFDSTCKQFFNINEYLEKEGANIKNGGLFCLTPINNQSYRAAPPVFFGLKHYNYNFIATSFREGQIEAQLPFYLGMTMPYVREYSYSPNQVSDLFSPGLISNGYDSLYIVVNQSLNKQLNEPLEYKIELIDASGKSTVYYRHINPMSHDCFWLSDLFQYNKKHDNSQFFTIWISSSDAYLKSFHALYRRHDNAMSFDDGSEGTLQIDPQV